MDGLTQFCDAADSEINVNNAAIFSCIMLEFRSNLFERLELTTRSFVGKNVGRIDL